VTAAVAYDRGGVYREARRAHEAGCCVIGVRDDGSKAPAGGLWREKQFKRSTLAELNNWFKRGRYGVGVVCGNISGGLEMLEFEGAAVADNMLEHFEKLVDDAGLWPVWERIIYGWMETTPSGGVHVYYRVTPEDPDVRPGNVKLARRPGAVVGKLETLIETRGEGGFSVIAPSYGRTHPTGQPWERTHGGPGTVATITWQERAALFAIARTFDVPAPPPDEVTEARPTPEILRVAVAADAGGDHDRWMDGVVAELNKRSWSEVLGAYGWKLVRTDAKHISYWRRPGKDHGISATTNGKGTDRFINFSSSVPFKAYDGVGLAPSYDRLDIIAQYSHHGDRVKAAAAVSPLTDDEKRQYGERKRAEETAAWDRQSEQLVARMAAADPPEAVDAEDDELKVEATVAADGPAPPFKVQTLAELIAEVDAMPPVGWLARNVWPADGYGVMAAEKKAGKTWLVLDLALAVAAGGRWLGHYPIDRPGPVLVFLGEGGKRKMLRRMRAVAAHHGITDLSALPVHIVDRVPHLKDDHHLLHLAEQLQRLRPVLVIVDPLYLAARAADAASLIGMGEVLELVQHLAQAAGAALMLVHHWNKTGQGSGAHRMSGAGVAEWGRVLVSVEVTARSAGAVPGSTRVNLTVHFEGDEIADQDLGVIREVSTETEELHSPMRYSLTVGEPGDRGGRNGLTPAQTRVLAILTDATRPLETGEIQHRTDGVPGMSPLRTRTVQDALKALSDAGLCADVSGRQPGSSAPARWVLRREATDDGF